MSNVWRFFVLGLTSHTFLALELFAVEPVTLQNVVAPAANNSNEPLVKNFSIERATHFLDSASLAWQKQRKCFTCHTNYAYLYARPLISSKSGAHATIRKFAEDLVEKRWKDNGPRWDAEVVATAAALAFNDSETTRKLHPLTKTALDRMWTLQRADGGWEWLKCNWPPMESDDHYGVTLAAIATGVAPGNYKDTPVARKGLEGIRKYLSDNPPPTLHHRAMMLWASSYLPHLTTESDKQAYVNELLGMQQPDGGWALASLGDWERSDDKEQDKQTSDGYGTGFVIFALRRAGLEAQDSRIKKGIEWLKGHQRQSGRWFTRSLNNDSKHFISHAGTAFTVMALAACDEIQSASQD